MNVLSIDKVITPLLLFSLFTGFASAVEYCRNPGTITHQNGVWSESFPNNQGNVKALCEGSLTTTEEGEFCIDGRMTYKQIKEALGYKNIFSPAASTISVQGHLVSGTGNAVLAGKAYYLYDFISSYTVDGTDYTDGTDILDNTLAASKGTISKVCFYSNLTQPVSHYEIRHTTSLMSGVDMEKLADANIVFAGKYQVTMEHHVTVEEPSGIWSSLSNLRMSLFNLSTGFPTPDFVLALIPVFPLTGILRQLIIGSGTFSTADYPQPLEAPDLAVENIQIDAPWTSLMTVMENGIFGDQPGLQGALIKRISASADSVGCWKEDMASIDMQAPKSAQVDLDNFAENVLLPALQAEGDVTLHLGKRLVTGSNMMAAAMSKFESCGASVNLSPSPCYHPACTRSGVVSQFEFPPQYNEIP